MLKFDLSIIIVNYNTRQLTLSCIKSVLDGSFSIKKEIIVVDNGSTDGSLSRLVKLGETIKLIQNKNNVGYAKATNQGMKIATGKYILLLNSDTSVEKNALEKLLAFADKTDDAGVVGCRLINKDGSTQKSCYNFPTIDKAIKQYWLSDKGQLNKFAPGGNKPVEVDIVVGAAFLITPGAIEKVGYLNERYFMYYEDFDYCRRVKQAGLKVYYLPDAGVLHLHGASGRVLADSANQWRRLIPSSKIYHGIVLHYLLNFIIWSGLKRNKLAKWI